MNNFYGFKIFLFFILSFAFAQSMLLPEVIVPKVIGNIKIDGYLNEDAWKETAMLDEFYETRPLYMKQPDVKTKVLICHDVENLYIGIICYDDDMGRVRADRLGKQEAYKIIAHNNDNISFILSTNPNLRESYDFAVNPYGVQYQFYAVEKSFLVYTEDINLAWFADAKILDSCWTVEIAIPFKSLHFSDQKTQEWGIIFLRWRPRTNDFVYECPPYQREGVPSYFSSMAKLHFRERLTIPESWEFLPSLFTGLNKKQAVKVDFTTKFGITGKYYITNEYLLNWAILPDYSQIESDASQVDVNTTFALYYPEKRSFFLEQKALFETPLQLFYTRTINDPLLALKFVGGNNGVSYGYIGAYDQHTPWVIPFTEQSFTITSNKKSFTNIVRIKKSIFGNSYVGFINSNRDYKTGFNRTFCLDGALYFFRNYSVFLQSCVSWTKEPNDSTIFAGNKFLKFSHYTSKFDGEAFFGKGFLINLNYGSKYLSVNGYYKGLSPEFRADNGFIQYNDFESRGISSVLNFWLKKFCVENIAPAFDISENRRFFNGQNEFKKTASLKIQFKRQTYTSVIYDLLSKEYQGVHFDKIWNVSNYLSSSPVKHFSVDAYCNYGREIDYRVSQPKLGYKFSPTVKLKLNIANFDLELNFNRYLFWKDDFNVPVYDIKILENEVNYAYSKDLNFRLLIQYNAFSRTILVSPLLSFEPSPLTILYIGSNQSLQWQDRLKSFSDFELNDSKVFIKLQYQFKL